MTPYAQMSPHTTSGVTINAHRGLHRQAHLRRLGNPRWLYAAMFSELSEGDNSSCRAVPAYTCRPAAFRR